MTDPTGRVFELGTRDPRELLTHMVAYGVAAIVEAATTTSPMLSWTTGLDARFQVAHETLESTDLAVLVKRHATRLAEDSAWPQERIELKGRKRGLMSPRLSTITDWEELARRRHAVLDRLTCEDAWLDQLFLWSLGEPCYWSPNAQGDFRQDDAASRLELQPRNQGSEIIGNRLSPLARAVAERTPGEITDGLLGRLCRDTVGTNRPDSRSGLGFRGPGPVDAVVSWCALWGISQFALTRSVRHTTTAGHIRCGRVEAFFVPIWYGEWTPARLRTILSSAHLRAVATEAIAYLRDNAGDENDTPGVFGASVGTRWLRERNVAAIVIFPVQQFGSTKAPERRAQRGIVYVVGGGRDE